MTGLTTSLEIVVIKKLLGTLDEFTMKWLILSLLVSCQVEDSYVAGNANEHNETPVVVDSDDSNDEETLVEPLQHELGEVVGTRRHNGKDIAKIIFEPRYQNDSSDGLPRLKVSLFSRTKLPKGTKFRLKFPPPHAFEGFVAHAFEGYSDHNLKYIDEVKWRYNDWGNKWKDAELFTTKEEGMSRTWFYGDAFEFEFEKGLGSASYVEMLFQFKDLPNRHKLEYTNIRMRASLDDTENGFKPFGSAEHSIWIRSGCDIHHLRDVLAYYSLTNSIGNGSFAAFVTEGSLIPKDHYSTNNPRVDTPILRVNSTGKIVVDNRQLIDLADGGNYDDQYEIKIKVSTTARSTKTITAFGRSVTRNKLNNDYAIYKFNSASTIPDGSMGLEIPVKPAREGEIELQISGDNKELLKFTFRVAPERSCLFAIDR